MTGALQLTWYNMPYLRVLQMGQILIFRGRVVKNGRLTMEQPRFTPEQYRGIMHSMQSRCMGRQRAGQ